MMNKIKSVLDANKATLILSHEKDDDLMFVHANDDRQEVICVALNEKSARAMMDALQEYVDDCVQKSYEKAKIDFPYKEGDRLLMSDGTVGIAREVTSDYYGLRSNYHAVLVSTPTDGKHTRSYWYGTDGYVPEYHENSKRWQHFRRIVRKLEDGE